jgi:hypothetical protein
MEKTSTDGHGMYTYINISVPFPYPVPRLDVLFIVAVSFMCQPFLPAMLQLAFYTIEFLL